MKITSHAEAFDILCSLLANEGRADLLFGGSVSRMKQIVPPFLVGKSFPCMYFEFPLIGDPYLDVLVSYEELEAGTRIDSEAAAGSGPILDWYRDAYRKDPKISFGFEVSAETPGPSAMRLQSRDNAAAATEFCEAAGEPDRARQYLDQLKRMPEEWQISYFGFMPGKPEYPLRVGGYLDTDEMRSCARNPGLLAERFDKIGFSAYNEDMLRQIADLLAAAPEQCDYQFNVLPDGRLSDVFDLEIKTDIDDPARVNESFSNGTVKQMLDILGRMGIADGHREKCGFAFGRTVPFENAEGVPEPFVFLLMPQWTKARWKGGKPLTSKMYYYGHAGPTKDYF